MQNTPGDKGFSFSSSILSLNESEFIRLVVTAHMSGWKRELEDPTLNVVIFTRVTDGGDYEVLSLSKSENSRHALAMGYFTDVEGLVKWVGNAS